MKIGHRNAAVIVVALGGFLCIRWIVLTTSTGLPMSTMVPEIATVVPGVSSVIGSFARRDATRSFERGVRLLYGYRHGSDVKAEAVKAMRREAAAHGADAVFIESQTVSEGWQFSASPWGASGGPNSETVFRAKAIVWK